MAQTGTSPGVYREERFVTPAALLPTGVPGFVGFGSGGGGAPVALQRPEELAARFVPAADGPGYLEAAVAGFFANGGKRCYVVGAAAGDTDEARATAMIRALERLAPLLDLDLVAAPDAMGLDDQGARDAVQRALAAHCSAQGDRFALLDAPPELAPSSPAPAAAVEAWFQRVAPVQPENLACYFPWVRIPAAGARPARAVPPSGHVAGIFARSDARVGVHKAPANEVVEGILDLEHPVDADLQGGLNPLGINCLRALPGRGLRVYGARTLSREVQWRYVNVRRVVLTLGRWIDRNLTWAAFEPNGPRLWMRVRRELDVHLGRLWAAGALKGASPAEAYYVKCDAETNPPEGREQGAVITEIGLAPAAPAELVVVRITQRAAGAVIGASSAHPASTHPTQLGAET